MKTRAIVLYGILFLFAFPILAGFWHLQMAGHYFVSEVHGIIADFFPPFAAIGIQGEYFIQPVRVVYTIWALYVLGLLLVPAAVTWILLRLYERDLGRYW
jgi:hypothetical protein